MLTVVERPVVMPSELEDLEARLLNLQGPTLTAVGQLQQQLGFIHKTTAIVAEHEKKTVIAAEDSVDKMTKLSATLTEKHELLLNQARNEIQEATQAVQRQSATMQELELSTAKHRVALDNR